MLNNFNYKILTLKTLVLLFYCSTSVSFFGQYTNKIIETPDVYENSFNYVGWNNQIISVSCIGDSNASVIGHCQLSFKKYDDAFNLIYTNTYYPDSGYIHMFRPSTLINVDTVFYVGGFCDTAFYANPHARGFVLKLNSSGNLIWKKYFFPDSVKSNIESIINIDTLLYVVGSITNYSLVGDGNFNALKTFVSAMDFDGTVLWTKYFTGSDQQPLKMTKIGNTHLLFTAFTQINGTTNQTLMYKLDLQGNVIWQKTIGDYNGETQILSATEMPDGRLLCYGFKSIPVTLNPPPPMQLYGPIHIWLQIRNSANGNLILDTLYEHAYTSEINYWQNVHFTTKGFYLLGKSLTYNPDKNDLFLAKYDNNLNLQHIMSYSERPSFHFGYYLAPHNNNGFLKFAGMLSDNSSNPNDEWFMIVDEYGCVYESNCTASINNTLEFSAEVKIYPNPCSDFVNVELLNYNRNSDLKYNVKNNLGQVLLKGNFTNNIVSISMNEFQDGLYLVELIENGNINSVHKIIKNQ